jgi:hypothetical protein
MRSLLRLDVLLGATIAATVSVLSTPAAELYSESSLLALPRPQICPVSYCAIPYLAIHWISNAPVTSDVILRVLSPQTAAGLRFRVQILSFHAELIARKDLPQGGTCIISALILPSQASVRTPRKGCVDLFTTAFLEYLAIMMPALILVAKAARQC